MKVAATEQNKKIGDFILDRIGNTPLIELRQVTVHLKNVKIVAKAEWFNPGGSVKDRAALNMVRTAIAEGKLTQDKTILDSSSGNTAIAYAMIGAALGYHVTMVVPENVSEERKKILHAYGAKIIYTNPMEGSDGAIREAHRLAQAEPKKYFMPDQYNNRLNPDAHYRTTGLEIWEQTQGRITHFLATIGTSGTVMGTARRLKELSPKIKCYAVEPEDALHGLEGMKHMPSSIVPGVYDPAKLDGVLPVNTDEAYDMTRRLAQEEGIFVGQSSGAVTVTALKLAEKLHEGVIVVIFPDGGDKYLTTRVWD